jgi:hypothetical protein
MNGMLVEPVTIMRLQIRLGGVAEKLFKGMVERVGAEQREREVVLDAFALYDFATKEKREGRRIGSFDPDTQEFKEITTPMLESLREDEAMAHAYQR